ncbi:hypothetical protein [Zavarzinia sp.]|uniref:hypothetical protein n=1 Tax=Zavarzinia sp. TaxID=2027920 RepID=UPI003BB50291
MSDGTLAVRDLVAAALVAGVPAFAGRVFLGRVTPATEAEIPCGAVGIETERVSPLAKGIDRVDFDLVVDVLAAGDGTADDLERAADALINSVSAALSLDTDRTLSGAVFDITGQSRDRERSAGGERQIGRGRLTLSCYLLREI